MPPAAKPKDTGPTPGYRPCVGLFLTNEARQVFVARRKDKGAVAWQMPQGGIDPGETPRAAALRELAEEIGTEKVEILGESAGWLDYDLPAELAGTVWGGRWRGQSQKWFALRFTGSDADIDLETAHQEFDAWKWVAADEALTLIVEFKRPVYEAVLREFRAFVS